jgi:hypothetical protein
MPSIEVTSNAFAVSVPLHITGNIGVGTNAPAYALDIVAPLSFGVNENPVSVVSSGTADARSLSVSSDGNVVVVGRANEESDGIIYVHEFDGSTWNTSNLTIQDVPPNTYTGYSGAWRVGARGSVSSDGTRLVAVRGFSSASQNANSAEIYHKVNGVWVSKALIHHVGSFGYGWAMSGDGNTVAFTAPNEPDSVDYTNIFGYVYVYKYNAGTDTWEQELSRIYENYPDSITLNNDGNVLAFSRTNFPLNQNFEDPAIAYVNVLKYTNGAWNIANDDVIITPPNGYLYWHYYGKSIRISADGKTLVVGAPSFSSGWGSTVLNAVHVYKSSDGSWVNPSSTILQPASYTSPSPNDYDNHFGNVVTVNANGTVIVVGAHGTNVNGISRAGRAWVFQLVNNVWTVVGTLDGTLQSMWFASAVDVTADGYYAFIASRYYDYTGNATLRGVTKYKFMNPGTAIHTTGHMICSGNMQLDGNIQMGGNMQMNGDIELDGNLITNSNIGIGVSYPTYPLHVDASSQLSSSYNSILYEDYTLWDAYIHRSNIQVIANGESETLIPDFGFDFMLYNTNFRNSTYVNANSYIMFGSYDNTKWFNINLDIEIFEIPALFIGAQDSEINSISYYSGQYNGTQAMYVFYDGYEKNAIQNLQKWCVIFQDGKISLFIKELKYTGPVSEIGLWNGSTWDIEIIKNQGEVNINNLAYRIHIGTNTKFNNALYIDGNLQTHGNIQFGLEYRYPPTYMTINPFIISTEPYGNGTYISSSSEGNSLATYSMFRYDNTGSFYGSDYFKYNENGEYVGNTSTTFTDFLNNNVSLLGVWIQIQLPLSIVLTKYSIKSRWINTINVPKKYVLLGSIDGITWKLIDDRRSVNVQYIENSENFMFLVHPNTEFYSYYRIVVNEIYVPSSQPYLGQLEMPLLTLFGKNTNEVNVYHNTKFNSYVGIGTSASLAVTHIYPTPYVDALRVDTQTPFMINKDGNVGIGTTSPATALVVNGTIRNVNGPSPTSGTSLVITGDGDIAPQSSDARYKTNVEDLPPTLTSLMNIRPVSYNWKDEPQKWCGLLAQEVAQEIPHAAWHDVDSDTYGVHYTPTIVTLLLKGIQELNEKVSDLTARVQNLGG